MTRLKVRLYEMSPSGETRAKSMYKHEGPVLDLCWSKVRESLSLSLLFYHAQLFVLVRMEANCSHPGRIKLFACST